MIGNEGLYFKRYEPDDIRLAAARIALRLPDVPLTTTEPSVSYRPEQPHAAFCRSFGDFLAPNIHPVFDRGDLEAAAAARWTREYALRLQRETKLPLVLKETGFPRAGQPKYTPASQRIFWDTLLETGSVVGGNDADSRVFLNVAFEAFDLPWKSEASGLEFERSWGLLTADRAVTPAFEFWRQRAERPE